MQSCFINALSSVSLIFFSVFLSPVFARFPFKHRRRNLEHCILFVPHPLLHVAFLAFSASWGFFDFEEAPKNLLRECSEYMMQLIVERFVAVLQDSCSVRSIWWKNERIGCADFCCVFSAHRRLSEKEPHSPAFCIMNDHFGKREGAQFTFSRFDTVHWPRRRRPYCHNMILKHFSISRVPQIVFMAVIVHM